jgi:hypothetical protein
VNVISTTGIGLLLRLGARPPSPALDQRASIDPLIARRLAEKDRAGEQQQEIPGREQSLVGLTVNEHDPRRFDLPLASPCGSFD